MQLWEWIAIGVFLLGFLLMGAVVFVRIKNNPLLLVGIVSNIWVQLKPIIITKILPLIIAYFARNTPDVEKQMADCVRKGGRWDNFKKKCVETR